MSFIEQIKPDWSLFLDRDGVINVRPVNDYVKHWSEFEFLPGAIEAVALLSRFFRFVFVVTNQQGVGKGLMKSDDLEEIHRNMMKQIEEGGGRLTRIYSCTDLENTTPNCRKPAPFMAYQAKNEFPQINFSRSIMVGDTLSDIQFGRNSGMHTVLVSSAEANIDAGLIISDLMELAELIRKQQNKTGK